jgi:hypothetical protein
MIIPPKPAPSGVEEANALMRAMQAFAQRVADGTATMPPSPSDFSTVPSAKQQREQDSTVPWWRRFFSSEPVLPSGVPQNPLVLPYVRTIDDQLKQMHDNEPVYTGPVQTTSDLDALFAQSGAPSATQIDRMAKAGVVTGGGAGSDGQGVGGYIWGTFINGVNGAIHPPADFTTEQVLAMAIAQRNALVAHGGSKALIRAWNQEIAYDLTLIRHGL